MEILGRVLGRKREAEAFVGAVHGVAARRETSANGRFHIFAGTIAAYSAGSEP